VDTINQKEDLKDFDYYFSFVKEIASRLV